MATYGHDPDDVPSAGLAPTARTPRDLWAEQHARPPAPRASRPVVGPAAVGPVADDAAHRPRTDPAAPPPPPPRPAPQGLSVTAPSPARADAPLGDVDAVAPDEPRRTRGAHTAPPHRAAHRRPPGPRRTRRLLVAGVSVAVAVGLALPTWPSRVDGPDAPPTTDAAPRDAGPRGGMRAELVLGAEPAQDFLPQPSPEIPAPLATVPARAWRLTLASVLGVDADELDAMPAHERPRSRLVLPLPAAGDVASTATTAVVSVDAGTTAIWDGLRARAGAPSRGGVATLLLGVDAADGATRWVTALDGPVSSPCQLLGRGELVACSVAPAGGTGGGADDGTVTIVETATGWVRASVAAPGCRPVLFLQEEARLYWAGTSADGACLAMAPSGVVLAVVPGVTELAWDDLTLTRDGPLLRTRDGSVLRTADGWVGFAGRVEPGPAGFVVQEVPGDELVYAVSDEGATAAAATLAGPASGAVAAPTAPVLRGRASTIVSTTEGRVVASIPGPTWRRADLGVDATPDPRFEGLVGAGTAAYTTSGIARVMLRGPQDEWLLDPVSPSFDDGGHRELVVVGPAGVVGRAMIDGDPTDARWEPSGKLADSGPVSADVVAVRGPATLLLSRSRAQPPGTALLMMRSAGDGPSWAARASGTPGALRAASGPDADPEPVTVAVVGTTIVVRDADGLVAYR